MPATLSDVGNALRNRLVAAGIDPHEAQREVELIVRYVTGWDTAQQHLHDDELIEEDQLLGFEEICEKRCERIPLQYCLEEAWFMGLRFNVRPGVLIPRADTETLVETTLMFLKPDASPWILDIGTGSGAIAISLAHLRPDLHAIALDVSKEALEVARENARLIGVSDRIQFRFGDWFEQEPSQKFDALVCNPPYIPLSKGPELAPEVRVYEPAKALFGLDDDGLGFYRNLAATAPEHLGEDGLIAVEVGQGQAEAVRQIFESGAWRDLQVHYDLNKIARVVSAFRR
jgi:release factor glutamine methyltransferase